MSMYEYANKKIIPTCSRGKLAAADANNNIIPIVMWQDWASLPGEGDRLTTAKLTPISHHNNHHHL